MIYITGETHRNFRRFFGHKFNKDDIVIILGNVGINYYLDEEDNKLNLYNFTLLIQKIYLICY